MTALRVPLIPFVVLWVALALGCAQKPKLDELDSELAFRKVADLYFKGKYALSAEGFDYYTLNFAGSAKVDSAQLLLAWSHFHLKEYILAADAFDNLARRFPNSPLVAEAMYMFGECYWMLSPRYSLDQDYTLRAIEAMQTFIDYFPNRADRVPKAEEVIAKCREKLAHKVFANGVIYSKMKDWGAAVIYFRGVIDEYYDTRWAPPATYELGRAYAKQKDWEQAREAFNLFLKKYPRHELAPKVRSQLSAMPDGLTEQTGEQRG